MVKGILRGLSGNVQGKGSTRAGTDVRGAQCDVADGTRYVFPISVSRGVYGL